ncbi:hypothetical protein ABID22_003816 [Pontibacter aydingkolensis]|uniref:HipA-like C-terminal domain-containing protein n=1 Tax=Pontibacter aydingkolensis TaxID=1911536 RepID=A0ABS7CZ64_9BACT|nr:hypothetical protein [Pontibacter aydingkolensis]MBW7469143.1 hypothetical protein [Pontibacter aydingkolensis]
MPDLYDISEWNILTWVSTGGTRSKMYVQSPGGDFYFFKESEKRKVKHYKYEFWSEIIAYELGMQLNLNMLRYDIAIYNDIIGCISKSMHNPDEEELVEGGKYLQAYEPEFSPEDKDSRFLYTFQLIDEALEAAGLDYIENIIEIILFDAIIGNSDRHQENWAVINKHSIIAKGITEIEKAIKDNTLYKYPKPLRWIINKAYKGRDVEELKPEVSQIKAIYSQPYNFAPIYDSGSSLGRELTDDKVSEMLKNRQQLDAYINRGTAEIYWEDYETKLRHFDLVNHLLESAYNEVVIAKINQFKSNFNRNSLDATLASIDILVPEEFNQYKIPQNRKELILTLVTLRLEKLIGLIT